MSMNATLERLRIDEATWASGTPERQHEWRLACNEIVEEGQFEAPVNLAGPYRGLVGVSPGRLYLELRGAEQLLGTHELPLQRIESLINEYIRTIVEMNKVPGANSPRLEALDIAKRITHDEAGEQIRASIASLRPDLPTARRFFTLFVTLIHDTTKLAAPPHRVLY
jgi:uncharacterized protein (UPF0262 family)